MSAITEIALIDACQQIGAVAGSNAPFTRGLTEWLNTHGKPIDVYTVGDLRQMVAAYNDAFNAGYTRVGGFPCFDDLKDTLASYRGRP